MSDLDNLKLYSGINPRGAVDAPGSTAEFQGEESAATSLKTMAGINPVGSSTAELLTGQDSATRPVTAETGISPINSDHHLISDLPLFTVTP